MKFKRFIQGVLLVVISFFLYRAVDINQGDSNKAAMEEVKEVSTESDSEYVPTEVEYLVEEIIEVTEVNPASIPRAEEVENLKRINGEVQGILTLPGTNIDYPILQSSDNDYYLYRDINREKNQNGSIYIDYESVIKKNPNNLIIYGHNMKNTNMFSDLVNFKDKEYFNSHENIYIYTDEGVKSYRILGGAVLDLTSEEKFFQFNSFIYSDETMNSLDYVEEIKKRALHFRDVPVEKDSNLVTLSTCTYETNDARFLLVGVEE